jgi:hypothetical protein
MGGLAKGLSIIEAFSSREFADAARLSGATRRRPPLSVDAA